jgi:hypothetical protein
MKAKVLSVRQPWASLLVHGFKDVENRTWATSYRGPLVIHAGKSPDLAAMRWLAAHYPHEMERLPKPLPFGALIGTVVLTDIVQESDSEWFTGPYGWQMAAPVAWDPPLPLGLFEIETHPDLLPPYSRVISSGLEGAPTHLRDPERGAAITLCGATICVQEPGPATNGWSAPLAWSVHDDVAPEAVTCPECWSRLLHDWLRAPTLSELATVVIPPLPVYADWRYPSDESRVQRLLLEVPQMVSRCVYAARYHGSYANFLRAFLAWKANTPAVQDLTPAGALYALGESLAQGKPLPFEVDDGGA